MKKTTQLLQLAPNNRKKYDERTGRIGDMTEKTEEIIKVSFVIPCYQSAQTLPGVVREIRETIQSDARYHYEIILVNDASPDDTFDTIQELCAEDENIIGVDFAKNFGQHAGLMAGMNLSTGDVVVCLDDDGQTPPCEVWKLLLKIEEGYDVAYARYEHKEQSAFKNFGSAMNSLMTETMLGKPKELYISSYFAAKRFVVEEMTQYKNAFPFVDGLILRTTANICNVDIVHRKRTTGKSGYTFRKLLGLWINGFTAFSVKPLRMATYSGCLTAVLGFVYAIYTIIKKLVDPTVPVGWSSTMAAMLVLGGLILLVLGLIGEYVGRMYLCQNNSPQYVIRSVINAPASVAEQAAKRRKT